MHVEMQPGETAQYITIEKGDLWSKQDYMTTDGTIFTDPVDWAAPYTMDGSLRGDPTDAAPVATFTFAYQTPTLPTPPNGGVLISLDTTNIPVGTYSFSIRLIDGSGHKLTVRNGQIRIASSPT